METARGLGVLADKWFMPWVPGKGRPILRLHGDVPGRTLVCAFTTREKCEAAIGKWFPGAVVEVEDSPTSVNDRAERVGYTVAVDLEDTGTEWKYSNFTRALFSPGGEC